MLIPLIPVPGHNHGCAAVFVLFFFPERKSECGSAWTIHNCQRISYVAITCRMFLVPVLVPWCIVCCNALQCISAFPCKCTPHTPHGTWRTCSSVVLTTCVGPNFCMHTTAEISPHTHCCGCTSTHTMCCTHTYTHTHTHTHTHTCTHARTHARAHTHTHTHNENRENKNRARKAVKENSSGTAELP